MSDAVTARIKNNPKYQELTRKRGRYAWTLALVVLVLFYAFAMTVAFNPAMLGEPIGFGMMTKGIFFILGMFIFFWGMMAAFVRRANTEFDALTEELISEAWKDEKK